MPLTEPTGMPVIVPDWLIVSAPPEAETSSLSLPPTPVSAPVSEPAPTMKKLSMPAPPVIAVMSSKVPPPPIVPLPGLSSVTSLPPAAASSVVLVALPISVSVPPDSCSARLPLNPAPSRALLLAPPMRVAAPMFARITSDATVRSRRASPRVMFSVACAVAVSELLPVPPLIDATAAPAAITKASAALPPTRLVTPVKFVVTLPSSTLPMLLPVIVQVDATSRPVRLELVLLPTSKPMFDQLPPIGVAVPALAPVSAKFAAPPVVERSSVLAAPVPPLTLPSSAPAPSNLKTSAAVPPAREKMFWNVVVPTKSSTLPLPLPSTVKVEPVALPVRVELVSFPTRFVMLL